MCVINNVHRNIYYITRLQNWENKSEHANIFTAFVSNLRILAKTMLSSGIKTNEFVLYSTLLV